MTQVDKYIGQALLGLTLTERDLSQTQFSVQLPRKIFRYMVDTLVI